MFLADVMREVSVYDTIDPGVNYAAKVRALTQFHAGRCVSKTYRCALIFSGL